LVKVGDNLAGEIKKVRTSTLSELKSSGTKFSCLTSYDATTAQIFDEAGIEVILIGDSAGNTVLGHDSTLEITVQEMISLGKGVSSAVKRALVVIDMPFGSYEVSATQAVQNAILLMKQSGAAAVKLEGGSERSAQVEAIVSAGIPVMGHLGFTPQSVHALGGFKVQGRGEAAVKLEQDAIALQKAGVFAIVLEMVPADLARKVTDVVSVPTIGIGAGNATDGQILVWQDFAGLSSGNRKFVKQYANIRAELDQAARKYRSEVLSGEFPRNEHSFES
jgi:3-methyl-2-oxobutanoate hydroxymethyltransferase